MERWNTLSLRVNKGEEMMELLYRPLGQSDLNLSVIGFGCWAVGNDWTDMNDQKSISSIRRAIDKGINLFDVAPIYGFGHAEEVLGKALRGRRDDVYVSSKCGLRWNRSKSFVWRDLSRENILKEIDESLIRLGVDYIDLYQLHWPDRAIPLQETLGTLVELRDEGKIRHIGLSNFSVLMMEDAGRLAKFASNQVLYNMIDRNSDRYHVESLVYRTENEILPYCSENNIGVIAYSPLCQGLLTDNFQRDKLAKNDVRNGNPQLNGRRFARNQEVVTRLKQIAARYGKPLSQLAINWLVRQEVISTVIVGAVNADEIDSNVESLTWSIENNDLLVIQDSLENEA